MIESLLQQIQEALTREAPTIERGKRCSCAEFIDPAMAFTGQKLKYLVSESLDGCCELFVSEHDGRSPCPLLRHEKWHTIAKVVILLEPKRSSFNSDEHADRAAGSTGLCRHVSRHLLMLRMTLAFGIVSPLREDRAGTGFPGQETHHSALTA